MFDQNSFREDSNRSMTAQGNALQYRQDNAYASHAYGFYPNNRSTSVTL